VQQAEPSAASSRSSSASSTTSAAAQQAKQQQQQQQQKQQPAAASAAGSSSNNSLLLRSRAGLEVALLFSSAAQGLVLQEYQDCSAAEAQGLLGLAVPHLLLSRQQPAAAATGSWGADNSGPVAQLPLQVGGLSKFVACRALPWYACCDALHTHPPHSPRSTHVCSST
jgi:hypothetical protein